MRTLSPFTAGRDSLIDAYSAGIGESAAVRRARLEAEAARAEAELAIKARSEFLANMNHELRTPLNAVIGFATMLRDGEDYALSAEQRASYAVYILQSADLLLGHLNTLLETAALDSGAVAIEEGEVDLADALAAAVVRAKIAAEARGVELIDKTSEPPLCGWGDAERLAQALDHVLRTAIKASPKDGRVHVRAGEAPDGLIEIAVRDHGTGLAPEAVNAALGAFREPNFGLERSFDGPGVGLAVAKTFLELQGGRFAIKSRLEEGTLVRLMLPPASRAARRIGARAQDDAFGAALERRAG